ncbi:MAG: CbtB domain-containing protein [Arenicellales bacterium]|jgi:cobalt transporter subunit CbtB
MQNQTPTAKSFTAARTARRSVVITKPLQLISAFLLGAVILYAAGFVNTSAVHNAAHDMRHSQGFPCH